MSSREKPTWRENNDRRNRENGTKDRYSHEVCTGCPLNKLKVNGVLMCTNCD